MRWEYQYRLASVEELISAAEKPREELGIHCRDNEFTSYARSETREEHRGNATFSEALKLARQGWQDAPALGEIAEKITPNETRTAHEMQHAVSGAFVDVSRYLEGHPENMMEFTETPAPRHIELAIQIGKRGNASAREMELSGAVAVAVIDTLAASGFSVTVTACSGNHGGSTVGAMITFPVKRAGEPLDLDQLSFWLCHPAAFRRILFAGRDALYSPDAYRVTRQHDARGFTEPPTAQDLGADYVIFCNPGTESEARAEYRRIIAEITAAL